MELKGKISDRIRSGDIEAQTKVDRPDMEKAPKSTVPHEGHRFTGRGKRS